jgi:hypothetical protein
MDALADALDRRTVRMRRGAVAAAVLAAAAVAMAARVSAAAAPVPELAGAVAVRVSAPEVPRAEVIALPPDDDDQAAADVAGADPAPSVELRQARMTIVTALTVRDALGRVHRGVVAPARALAAAFTPDRPGRAAPAPRRRARRAGRARAR